MGATMTNEKVISFAWELIISNDNKANLAYLKIKKDGSIKKPGTRLYSVVFSRYSYLVTMKTRTGKHGALTSNSKTCMMQLAMQWLNVTFL